MFSKLVDENRWLRVVMYRSVMLYHPIILYIRQGFLYSAGNFLKLRFFLFLLGCLRFAVTKLISYE